MSLGRGLELQYSGKSAERVKQESDVSQFTFFKSLSLLCGKVKP